MQYIAFDLNDEQFAIETLKVINISDIIKITKVPLAPKYIKGLINLRGNVVSILDINVLLGKDEKNSVYNSIIILNSDNELFGITVNDVIEVFDVKDEEIQKVDGDDNKKEYAKGVVYRQNDVITIIDIDKLLSHILNN